MDRSAPAANIVTVSLTEQGKVHAQQLPYVHEHGQLGDTVRQRWQAADGFVLFCAVGIAVRVIGPLLESKDKDPAVVVVDEAANFVVPVSGGHHGANQLAVDVADVLEAQPVITTATDATGVPALDSLPGFVAVGDIAETTRLLVDGMPPIVDNTLNWPVPNWAQKSTRAGQSNTEQTSSNTAPSNTAQIIVTDMNQTQTRGQPAGSSGPTVWLHPPSLVVGVGASSDAPAEAAEQLLNQVLADNGLSRYSISAVATIDRRANDPVIQTLGLPVRSFTGDQLAPVDVPNPSDVVRAEVGTSSVAEAAALLVAGPGAELVVQKQKGATATVAIARRRQPGGHVSVVGIGPGDPQLRTPQATAAIRNADVVIGYRYYVDQISSLCQHHQQVIHSPIGAEVDRCTEAVKRAAEGQKVALVCSGDPGVFAMATLVLDLAPSFGGPEVEIVPGVTASLASAAILGAPFAHDHALISLSDLLTPWEVIERRVAAIAQADMAVAFYNPRSKRRITQLERAIILLAECRPPTTPVAVVINATRPQQQVYLSTLAEFDPDVVDMFSLVVVGSSTTQIVDGKIVTPRGYNSKTNG